MSSLSAGDGFRSLEKALDSSGSGEYNISTKRARRQVAGLREDGAPLIHETADRGMLC
jgi:hypothetical protein